jgi:hypothetical protein
MLSVLLVAGTALAAKPFVPQDDPCDATKDQWKSEVGYGEGATDAAAREAARADARELLYKALCPPGSDPWRCGVLWQNISPWEGKVTGTKGRLVTACATAVIPVEYLDAFDRDARAVEQKIFELAVATKWAVGESRTVILDPVWSNGTPAAVGPSLVGRLRGELGKLGFVEYAEVWDPARELVLELTLEPAALVVDAKVRNPADGSSQLLPGFKVPAGLFPVSEADRLRAASDPMLGISGGRRVGAGGLVARLQVPSHDGRLCHGERYVPSIITTKDARIRVFSVAADGHAELVWPIRGAKDEVDGGPTPTPMNQLEALWSADADERLVAVAVPAGTSFGAMERWTEWCSVPGQFGPTLYPDGAAVAASTFTIAPNGASGCPHSASSMQDYPPPPVCQ